MFTDTFLATKCLWQEESILYIQQSPKQSKYYQSFIYLHVYGLVKRIPSMVCIVGDMIPAHTLQNGIFYTHFNIILPRSIYFSKLSLHFRFPNKFSMHVCLSRAFY
jgi:hypothetical protein